MYYRNTSYVTPAVDAGSNQLPKWLSRMRRKARSSIFNRNIFSR